MGPLFLRVDDRLIHGQVTVGWRQRLRYRELWVVDPALARDAAMREVLCAAAPSGVRVRVYDVPEALAALGGTEGSPSEPCLILVRAPEVALALVEGGTPLSQVNVGNLSPRPGSRRVWRTISLTPDHAAALDALAERGIEVTFQLAPEGARAAWSALRRRYGRG